MTDRSLWWYRWLALCGLVFDLLTGWWDYSINNLFGTFQFFFAGVSFAMILYFWFLIKTSKEDKDGDL